MKSLEIRPGNRSVVHHVLIYYRAKPDGKTPPIARANQQDQSNPPPDEPGVSSHPRRNLAGMPPRLIATYAPGTNPQVAPAGTAFRLEPGGILELQMHYTATGQPATDRTKVGITFATEPAPPREVRAQHFMNMTLKLPARAADMAVTTDLEFLQDATVWGLFPHTHLRGKAMGLYARAAGRRKEIHPLGAAVRLQLADVLHVHRTAAGAERVEDCFDCVVRQLRGEQEQSQSERRRVLGRSDLAGDAVHRRMLSPRF